MTIETLLELSTEDLEKMTEAELLSHFAPYLHITRPERASQVVTKSKASTSKKPANEQLKHIAEQYGFKGLFDKP